jgi:hypothetical protein
VSENQGERAVLDWDAGDNPSSLLPSVDVMVVRAPAGR